MIEDKKICTMPWTIQPVQIQENFCMFDDITPNPPVLCCIDSVGQCIRSIYFPNVCVYIKKIQLTRTAFLGIPLKSVDNIVKNYKQKQEKSDPVHTHMTLNKS